MEANKLTNIGRKIYYELSSGNVLVNTGELSGKVRATTTEEDYTLYASLSDKNPEAVGCLQLEYGQFKQDFESCNGYKVTDGELEFSYPDPENPEAPPEYVKPLSQAIAEREQRLSDIELALADIFTA